MRKGGGVEEGGPRRRDSGKHAESVIGGEISILDAMGGRFGGRGRQMHRRGWDLKAKGALKAWQGQCFRAFH